MGSVIKVMLRHPVGILKNSPFCKKQPDIKELEQDLSASQPPPDASPQASSTSPSQSVSPRPDRKPGAKKAPTPKP